MGLDFTNIKDQPGAAIFFIHDGSVADEQSMLRLAKDVGGRTKKQQIMLSVADSIGKSVIQFYGLKGSRFVLIVRDDDQLHHCVTDGEVFDPAQIAYLADQAG